MMGKLIIILLIIIRSVVFGVEIELEVVRTIGDERDDYFFYQIGDVVVSGNQKIYVIDLKGCNISKYSWNGDFIKRTGKRGYGPGDFISPTSIYVKDNVVRVYNRMSFSIVSLDNDLKIIDYQKLKKLFFLEVDFLGGNTLIGVRSFSFRTSKTNLISIFNKSESILNSFYNNDKITGKYLNMDIEDLNIYSTLFNIVTGISNSGENIIVTQKYMHNLTHFSIYNIKGKLVNKFSFKYKKNYQFPNIKRLSPGKGYPYFYIVDAMFVLENHIFIYINPLKKRNVSTNIKEENHFLIFDRYGKFIARKNIKRKFGEKFYQIISNNYLIGSRIDGDIEKIVITKISISK